MVDVKMYIDGLDFDMPTDNLAPVEMDSTEQRLWHLNQQNRLSLSQVLALQFYYVRERMQAKYIN